MIKVGEHITLDLSIDLVPNVDILNHLGTLKKEHQLLIGFALETDNEIENATKKIAKKNLDAIVLNSLNDKGAGFSYDTNKITFINKKNQISKFKLKSKNEVSVDIFNQVIKLMDEIV